MTFEQQAEVFMTQLGARKRNPVSHSTLISYRSHIDSWIRPVLGDLDVTDIRNASVKRLVDEMNSESMSSSSINIAVGLVKQILKSATGPDGEQLYPRTWNNEFMDVPTVNKLDQTAPIPSDKAVQEAIRRAPRSGKALYVILAATGLRIGELQVLRRQPRGNFDTIWDSENAVIRVNSTWSRGRFQEWPKTEASIREIDLPSDVNSYLLNADLPIDGWMFPGAKPGTPVSQPTVSRHLQSIGIDEGAHAFRRFRATHLAKMNVPSQLIKFWLGHGVGDITDRYIKIGHDIQARKEWASKAGTGFKLNLYEGEKP